jgi:homocysteine S-methyltransferase
MRFAEALAAGPPILAEGSVVERLRRDPSVRLDPHIAHAGFIYELRAAAALERIYRGYLEIGRTRGLPMLCLTPTWRANPERLRLAGLGARDVNGDAVRFLGRIREGYGGAVYLGGLTGCYGDAYRPEEALAVADAAAFHRPQARALAEAGVDFLFASTLGAASEALGIARAMAPLDVPYLLSFIIGADGALLDGTPLGDAVAAIDGAVSPAPAAYMLNCVHTSVFASAAPPQRVAGLQANTSRKSPRELEGLAELETEDPQVFAEGMAELHRRFGLRILGGCCGTDERHIDALAARLAGGLTS